MSSGSVVNRIVRGGSIVADRDAERAIYFTRTSFMMRPETFQS